MFLVEMLASLSGSHASPAIRGVTCSFISLEDMSYTLATVGTHLLPIGILPGTWDAIRTSGAEVTSLS